MGAETKNFLPETLLAHDAESSSESGETAERGAVQRKSRAQQRQWQQAATNVGRRQPNQVCSMKQLGSLACLPACLPWPAWGRADMARHFISAQVAMKSNYSAMSRGGDFPCLASLQAPPPSLTLHTLPSLAAGPAGRRPSPSGTSSNRCAPYSSRCGVIYASRLLERGRGRGGVQDAGATRDSGGARPPAPPLPRSARRAGRKHYFLRGKVAARGGCLELWPLLARP